MNWERSYLMAVDHPYLGDRRLEQALLFSLYGLRRRSGVRDPGLSEVIAAFREDALWWSWWRRR